MIKTIKCNPRDEDYIGYTKGEYGCQSYFSVYKISEKTFLFVKLKEKPNNKIYAIQDEDFNEFLDFQRKRFLKFYGITGKSYYYQLFESVLRYNYTEEDLFNFLLKQLPKISKNTVENSRKLIMNQTVPNLNFAVEEARENIKM